MRLSTAIKKGSKSVKQVGCRILQSEEGKLCGCALGMALVGALGVREARKYASDNPDMIGSPYEKVVELFPELRNQVLGRHGYRISLENVVIDMNDTDDLEPNQIVERLREKGY